MRTGEPSQRPACAGFTYLGLLLVLALGAAALATLGQRTSTWLQQQREAELLFRGAQISEALRRYHAAVAPRQWPASLDELLSDARLDPPAHHLRRLYADPFTGRADWVPILDEASGRIQGVHSRSRLPRMHRRAAVPTRPAADGSVGDWQFMAVAAPAMAASQPVAGPPTAQDDNGGPR
jgi:type II secretory pathway pseudopilin PulG